MSYIFTLHQRDDGLLACTAPLVIIWLGIGILSKLHYLSRRSLPIPIIPVNAENKTPQNFIGLEGAPATMIIKPIPASRISLLP